MPYSFTKIEENKSKVIGFVFAFLVVFYFLGAWIIYYAAKISVLGQQSSSYLYVRDSFTVSLSETLTVLFVAFFAGIIHWTAATHNLIDRICRVLRAESLNPQDTYHQMLQNIIDEVSVATGGKKMEGVVIPTLAMNAFALCDFNGRAVIGVTEGLLARLTRAEIEAVVGHEAAHVVSGDCLATTVTSSLFQLYGSLLSGMRSMMGSGSRGYRSRGSGSIGIIYVVVWLINMASNMVNMFVSREREFRADAISARLTRDPLSLAEALYKISNRWRGAGISGEELEAIFIINPKLSSLDEGSGLFSDLFSTHPPVEKRLNVLLDMAHADISALEESAAKQENKPRQPVPEPVAALPLNAGEWFANKDGAWLGPFNLSQVGTLGWLKPDTWVKRMGAEHISRAYEDLEINNIFQKKYEAIEGSLLCPKCQAPLRGVSYEGTIVNQCVQCYGALVGDSDVKRIIIREDVGFSERIVKLAEQVKKEEVKLAKTTIDLKTVNLLACPQCRNAQVKMLRSFYSLAFFVEVDRCVFCGSIWFDKDELEILQYLIEKSEKEGET